MVKKQTLNYYLQLRKCSKKNEMAFSLCGCSMGAALGEDGGRSSTWTAVRARLGCMDVVAEETPRSFYGNKL